MSYQRTFAIRVTCDHEPNAWEEDRAMVNVGDGIADLVEDLRAVLPAGWHAEEAPEVGR